MSHEQPYRPDNNRVRDSSGRDIVCSLYHQHRSITHGVIKMKTDTGKFSFAIPEGHAQAGEKVNKTFEFKICETQGEAETVMTEKKWSLVTMVNDNLKANARSNAYQAALLPYKPSEVSPEDIKERMIRDYIRMGVPESAARNQVDTLLANLASPVTA